MDLTKEMVEDFMKQRQLDIQMRKKSKEIVEKISLEIKSMFIGSEYLVGLNISDDGTISLSITINKNQPELYSCDNDIFYNEASFLIELRNIKDVLYDIRKKMEKPKPKSLWRRFLDH